MARVKLAPLVTSISGSIGGLTIQRNKYGTTLRAKPLPILSATAAQLVIRAYMREIQAAWQALTDDERLQWNRFLDFSGQTIKHSNSVKLSGHSLYLKYQMFRLICGESLLTTITYVPMPEVPNFLKFFLAFPNFSLHLDGIIDCSDYIFMLKVSSPRLPTRAFSPKGLLYASTVYFDASTFTISSSYTALFGALPSVGMSLHYSLTWFSMLAPIYGSTLTGKAIVTNV